MSIKRHNFFIGGQGQEGRNADFVLASDYDRDVLALRSDYDTACADAMGVARKLAEMQADRDSLAADNLRLREALAAIVATPFNWRESGARQMGEIAVEALSSNKE
jgi:hypothetical protein